MKYRFSLVVFSFISLILVGCVEEPQNATKSEGDIVWVGNGAASPDLKWAFAQGFIIDLKNPDGLVYTMSLGVDGVHEVLTNTKDETILARIDWMTKGKNDEKIVKLQVHETVEQKSCRHYETKSDGLLVCREDLENLLIHPDFAPDFLVDGRVLYVNESRELHLKSAVDDRLLASSIDSYFLDRSQRLFVKNQFSTIWHLINWNSAIKEASSVPLKPIDTKDVVTSLEFSAFRVFLGDEKDLFALMMGESSGLYKLNTDSNAFELIEAWPATLELIEDATDQRLGGKPLVLKALDKSVLEPTENLYQITENGIVLAVEKATSTLSEGGPKPEEGQVAASDTASTMAVQSNDLSLLYLDEVDGKKSIQFCDRNFGTPSLGETLTSVDSSVGLDENLAMTCKFAPSIDGFVMEEVALLDSSHFLAIGRFENQEPAKELPMVSPSEKSTVADAVSPRPDSVESTPMQTVIVYSVQRNAAGFELREESAFDLPDSMLGVRYVELPKDEVSTDLEDSVPGSVSTESPEEPKTDNQSQHLPR